MHNMALALHQKGFIVTGSDDAIFEPSKSRLKQYGLLPKKMGWIPDSITTDLDAVILGMHAKIDNPELKKAKELNIPIYSYPEYIYKQSKNKKRIVIGGSHGKTSITAMILHVLQSLNIDCDYMVGAQLNGFNTMVKLSHDAPIIILEGDEYLSSPIDRRPKFHLYKPHIALLSGIAWDHINVFKTFNTYVNQFKIFVNSIIENGTLVYNSTDEELSKIVKNCNRKISYQSYKIDKYKIENGITYIINKNEIYPIKIFGEHNLENISGASHVCKAMGVKYKDFYESISSFKGASNRLELIYKNENSFVYKDFAHSPSKVVATTKAVKKQHSNKKLIACFELHTYSSLNAEFMTKYKDTLRYADECIICYSEKNMKIKRLKPIDSAFINESFNHDNLEIAENPKKFEEIILSKEILNSVVLMMSSGKFGGFDLDKLINKLK